MAAVLCVPVAVELAALPLPRDRPAEPVGPVAVALNHSLSARGAADLAAFYAARDDRPLWVSGHGLRREAWDVPSILAGADGDGLDPGAYGPARLAAALSAARGGDAAALARAELVLSDAFARYLVDLHTPAPAARMAFADPAIVPPLLTRSAALTLVARAPSLSEGLAAAQRMNPIYGDLRTGLAAYRAQSRGGGPQARLILVNLDRARALPPQLGAQYILVDTPGQRMTLYDHGQVSETMKAIVGRPTEPTPIMAGVIRYAVFEPYWNVPVDLVRDTLAPQVLREGPGALEAQHMDVLSDWTDGARVVDPAAIDWPAVAAGRLVLRVRQRPGPDNMMGAVKLMLPNPLGVYLHDTPNKAAFAGAERRLSAGCVRLERAGDLARRLLGAAFPTGLAGVPEQRIDLPRQIPVYITYFTVLPEDGRIVFRRDIYGRDPALMAHVQAKSGAGPLRAPSGRPW